jgi:hypothetical protein
MLNGPMIEVLGGQAMIHDNSLTIYPNVVKGALPGTAIVVGPGAREVSVHHNQLNGNRIENQAGLLGRSLREPAVAHALDEAPLSPCTP